MLVFTLDVSDNYGYVNALSVVRCLESLSATWNHILWLERGIINHHKQCGLEENFAIITVSADGLAPLGARPSAATAMNNFGSCIFVGYM